MTREADLPCSDCGSDLIDRAVPAHELPLGSSATGTVTVAVCPECGARHYPDETVRRLTNGPDGSLPGSP